MNEIPIAARKIKISVPLRPEGLPGVPLEGPIGDLTLRLALEGSGLSIPARINGKSYRRMIKTVAEKGADNVVITLQGELVARPDGGPQTRPPGHDRGGLGGVQAAAQAG